MHDGKADSDHCTPRVPGKRYYVDAPAVQNGNCRREKEEEDGHNSEIEDQRSAKNKEIRDFLKHCSLHNGDGPVHERVDHAVIIIGTRGIEPLAE